MRLRLELVVEPTDRQRKTRHIETGDDLAHLGLHRPHAPADEERLEVAPEKEEFLRLRRAEAIDDHGHPIAYALRGVVDDMVVNMVDVGEETGDLDKMLIKVADVYDEEVDGLVASMMSLLEPMIIVFLGLMVGTIVVSLFLPLISLMTGMAERSA